MGDAIFRPVRLVAFGLVKRRLSRRIEHAIDNFDIVFLRNEDSVAQMGRGRLTRDELAVLELVNGKNTVKEIVRKSRMGSFDVSKMLYRLLSIKLVRRRVLPVAV